MIELTRERVLAGVHGLIYIISTCFEVSSIKALGFYSGVELPVFTALILNQAWVLLVPTWLAQRRRYARKEALRKAREAASQRAALLPSSSPASATSAASTAARSAGKPPEPTAFALLRTYVLMGLIVFGITLFRNTGVTFLPASVAAILLSSSLVWNMALSRMLLGRRFIAWHYVSVALGTAAMAVLGVNKLSGKQDVDARWLIGACACLLGGLCIALMSVTTSLVTATWGSARSLRISELTIVSSLIASLLLVPAGFVWGEFGQWASVLGAAYAARGVPRYTLLALCVAMPLNKSVVRSAKYASISYSSALVFELIQANGSIVSSLANVALFREPAGWDLGASIVLLAAAFAAFLRARIVQDRRAAEAARQAASDLTVSASAREGEETPLLPSDGPALQGEGTAVVRFEEVPAAPAQETVAPASRSPASGATSLRGSPPADRQQLEPPPSWQPTSTPKHAPQPETSLDTLREGLRAGQIGRRRNSSGWRLDTSPVLLEQQAAGQASQP